MSLPPQQDNFVSGLRMRLLERLVTPEIDAWVDRFPKPVGSFGYDPWGYNERAARVGLAVTKWLYDHYFRVIATGLENIPPTGRVLIVANHSGQLPLDGVLIATAMATNEHGPRAPRAMIERFFPTVPWLGNILQSLGSVIGDPHNCTRMLCNEEAVIVFPEGTRGSGKPYSKRYQLQRFGNGFLNLAIRHNTPIIPVAVIGCEETLPSLGNFSSLAKLMGLPYIPIVAPVVLPARVRLHFGKPLHFPSDECSEARLEEHVEQVKEAISALIERGLQERQHVFT